MNFLCIFWGEPFFWREGGKWEADTVHPQIKMQESETNLGKTCQTYVNLTLLEVRLYKILLISSLKIHESCKKISEDLGKANVFFLACYLSG